MNIKHRRNFKNCKCSFTFLFNRSDYLESGGFNLELQEWGEEDVLLFRKFAQSNLTVVRAPDPNIFHLWHEKLCSPDLSEEHYRQCIKSKTLNEGSHTQLGYMVLQDEIKGLDERRKKLMIVK